MDLSIPLVGILGVIGFNLNKPINSREYTNKRVKIPSSELANGKTIYEAKKFARIQQEERKRYEKIRKNNELVALNSKSDIKNYEPVKKVKFLLDNPNDYKVPVKMNTKEKVFNGPMFNQERYFIPEDSSKLFKTEGFSDVSELTGEKTDYSHQNMVPFFGGKVKNGSNTYSLGKYTGTDNDTRKKEIEGITNGPVNNVNGNVIFTDTIQQDRFIVSNNQTALLPFKQERVKPIPGEYNRGEEKTIEELRTVNPKTTLEGRINPGKTIAKRALQAKLPDTRNKRFYDLDNRQFTTTGEDQGTYYQETDQYRETRKYITAESNLNQNAGVNYQYGEILRATKNEDGFNTFVPEDKRGHFKADWIRSRKNVVGKDSAPTKENLLLRTQERESGNRQEMGNATDKLAGYRQAINEQLKTTNKELSLYTYKGGSSGNSIFKPENRDAYYDTKTKTKQTAEYFAGGKKSNAPGIGVENINFDSKERVVPEMNLQSSKFFIQPSTSIKNYGEVLKTRYDSNEYDYTSRINGQEQKRSYDRILGTLDKN